VAVNFPIAAAESVLQTNQFLIGSWTILTVILTAAGAVWFAGTVARPLQVASQAATGLARDRAVPLFRSRVIEANHVVSALHSASLELANAHRRQEILLKELNHRVKNLLSVVIAMAKRTLPHGVANGSRDLLIHRLNALARTHDLLLESEWRGAELTKIIVSELTLYTGRIEAEGPEIFLKPNTAQMFAMILHELATNSAKYGALSAAGGHIDLRWRVEKDEQPGFTLTWRESGGPVVTPPTQKGFGATLLQDSLPEASGSISYRSEGIVYELKAPLSAVAEHAVELADNRPRKIMSVEAAAWHSRSN
jgi:two-component sensor histidine kinase